MDFVRIQLQKSHFTKQTPWLVLLQKVDTPVAATVQRTSSGGIFFAIHTKIITK